MALVLGISSNRDGSIRDSFVIPIGPREPGATLEAAFLLKAEVLVILVQLRFKNGGVRECGATRTDELFDNFHFGSGKPACQYLAFSLDEVAEPKDCVVVRVRGGD